MRRIESIVLSGGRLPLSVFRGWAKTWILERAALWAALYGHRVYVVLYGATGPLAKEILGSIKNELYDNDLLVQDFPESCYPFRRLEQKAQRQNQTQYGALTGCRWLGDRVIFGRVLTALGEWSEASGTIIVARGITSGTRGLKKGTTRPDFVLADDIQTDRSAKSTQDIENRLNIITSALLNLPAHFSKPLAIVVIGSVIASNDLMERLLALPQWQGERIRMVAQWANAHDTLWLGQYAAILCGYDRSDPDAPEKAKAEATAFYLAHQEEMDAGCIVTWSGCYGQGEVSAVQHAYNKLIELGKVAFSAEMQSTPIRAEDTGFVLPAAKIVQKVSQWNRGVMPPPATLLTAFIDVQNVFLPYAVCAWEPDFTGHVMEYGAFPEQSATFYTVDKAWPTLADWITTEGGKPELREQGIEPIIGAGLDVFLGRLLAKRWAKPDGTEYGLNQVLIDTGYLGHLVYAAIQRLRQPGATLPRVMPSKGFGTTATREFYRYARKDGDTWGDGWGAKHPKAGELRRVDIDTNHFKLFLHQRLKTGIGARGCLTLYHDEPAAHGMLAEQLTSEVPELAENKTRDRSLWLFTHRDKSKENHLLDALVGCCAGASMLGIHLSGGSAPKRSGGKMIRLSDLRRQHA